MSNKIVVPVGYIYTPFWEFEADTVPGWLPLDGRSISAREYPEFAEVWPPAPGSPEIVLPNRPGSWVKVTK